MGEEEMDADNIVPDAAEVDELNAKQLKEKGIYLFLHYLIRSLYCCSQYQVDMCWVPKLNNYVVIVFYRTS